MQKINTECMAMSCDTADMLYKPECRAVADPRQASVYHARTRELAATCLAGMQRKHVRKKRAAHVDGNDVAAADELLDVAEVLGAQRIDLWLLVAVIVDQLDAKALHIRVRPLSQEAI